MMVLRLLVGQTASPEALFWYRSTDHGVSSDSDVRFRNHGLDAIEVQDNGSGIVKDDHESLGW